MYKRQTALVISLFLIAVCFLQFLVYCHQSQLLSSSTVDRRFIATDLTAPEDALKTSVPVEAGSVALLVLAAIWRWVDLHDRSSSGQQLNMTHAVGSKSSLRTE